MKILRLDLQNWGPYFGHQSIDLDVTPHAPVVLIRGENMRGKTSLLRAVVWGLYGKMRQQDGRSLLDVSEMVNRDALEDGSAEFEVSIYFEHDGQKIELKRSASAEVDGAGNINVRLPKATLIVGEGNALPEQQIPAFIENILSEDISDFYLFDGEMLYRFDERLREDRESSRLFIRDQIERALGLPFLTRLRADLTEIESALADQVKKASRNNKNATKLRDDLDEVEDAIEIVNRDLDQLRADGVRLRSEIEEIDKQLEAADEARESFYKRKSLENQLETDERKLVNFRQALSSYASKNWWFPLAGRLHDKRADLTSKLANAEALIRQRMRLDLEIETLESQVDEKACPTCGQLLPHDHGETNVVKLQRLIDERDGLQDSIDLKEVNRGLSLLNQFSGGASIQERVDEQDKDIRGLRIAIDKARDDIRVLDELLSGNSVEFVVLESRRRDAKDSLSETSSKGAQRERDVSDLRTRRASLRSQLARLPEVDPLDGNRMKVYSEAVETVANAFDIFRASMREQVEHVASEIFLRLTTEKDYTGVLLRSDYSLAVLGPDGQPVNLISAGANQVLTMSFIGALARSARDEAPMIMDTPLGRLDKGHRASILDWVGTMPQVVLFVQSGEYDAGRDAKLLAGKVGREYEIERLGAKRSRVVAV